MKRENTRSGESSILAVLHQAGGQWSALIADTRNGRPRVLAARQFSDADAIDPWLEEQRAGQALVLLPAASVICRTSSLPMADAEQLQGALELQAESVLLGIAPSHRSAMAVLPAAPGETNRTGLIVAWPESAAIPKLQLAIPTRYAPDVAAMAGLLNGHRPTEPMLWIDRKSGSVAIALSHSAGVTFRATQEDLGDGPRWLTHVSRSLAETGLNVGHSAAFVESMVASVGEQLSSTPPDGGRLLLPDGIRELAAPRVEDAGDDPHWWATYGINIGGLLLRVGDLAALTTLRASLPVERPSLLGTLTDRLSRPSFAIRAGLILVAVLALGQPLANYLRLQILNLRHGDLKLQLQEVRHNKDLKAMYEELREQRWTMTKLIADLACSTPENIELDSIRISHGDTISVTGTVLPDTKNDLSAPQVAAKMQSLMQGSQLFADVTLDWGDPNNFGNYQFDLSAQVMHPHRDVKYTPEQDFGVLTLRHRIYGDDPNGEGQSVLAGDPPVETVEVEPIDETMMAKADELPSEDSQVKPEVPRTTPPPGTRRPRPSERPGDQPKSRSGGDSLNADVRTAAEDIPPPLSQEQINSMGKSEALEMLGRVGRARNYAKKQQDEELRERLNGEWQMLLNRVKEAN